MLTLISNRAVTVPWINFIKVGTQRRFNNSKKSYINKKQALTSDWNAWDVDGFMSPILPEFLTTWRVVDTLTGSRRGLLCRTVNTAYWCSFRCPLLTLPPTRSNSVHSGSSRTSASTSLPTSRHEVANCDHWKSAIVSCKVSTELSGVTSDWLLFTSSFDFGWLSPATCPPYRFLPRLLFWTRLRWYV